MACRGKGGNDQKSGNGGANNDQLVANAQQISRVLGTEEEDEEEMNEPMLRSNSRNGLNSPGS